MILTTNLLASTFFVYSKHPIMMIICLMIFTVSSSALSTSLINNAWYSYTLLLIMIGGMMIVFIYMSAILPNTKLIWGNTSHILMIISMWCLISNFSKIFKPQMLNNNPVFEFMVSYSTIILASYLLMTLFFINIMNTHKENNMRSLN